MRLVHLSDIHLSKANYREFSNNYKEALILDLRNYHDSTPIDLIVITGDLVDKGGYSLFEIPEFEDKKGVKSAYDIFEEEFIIPIVNGLNISKNRILFVPGNHDVDERGILLYDERQLVDKINDDNIEDYLSENTNFKHSLRIKQFKEFEKKYHYDNDNYKYSPNESTYVFSDKSGVKVGFLLLNDSWRCKSIKLDKEEDNHHLGVKQLYRGIDFLDNEGTELNICLLHHSLDDFKESIEVKGILQRKNIELFLYGHLHTTEATTLYTPHGTCNGFRGRAALFKPDEIETKYHAGYQILDIDLNSFIITEVHYRKYFNDDNAKSFNMDLDTAPHGGIDRNILNSNKGFKLLRENRMKKTQSFDVNLFKS